MAPVAPAAPAVCSKNAEFAVIYNTFAFVRSPKRAWHPIARVEGGSEPQKSNFQLPKGPCGHDIRSTGLEKPFKISSRQLKMEKCFFMKKWNLYWKNTIKSNLFMKTR